MKLKLTIQVFQTESSAQPFRSFLLLCRDPSVTLQELCVQIVQQWQKTYPQFPHFAIKKLQNAAQADLDLDYTVSDIFDEHDNIIRVVHAPTTRDSSIPPQSTLRPQGQFSAARKRPIVDVHGSSSIRLLPGSDPTGQNVNGEGTHGSSHKRRRLGQLDPVENADESEDVGYVDPDTPLKSRERDDREVYVNGIVGPVGHADPVMIEDSQGSGRRALGMGEHPVVDRQFVKTEPDDEPDSNLYGTPSSSVAHRGHPQSGPVKEVPDTPQQHVISHDNGFAKMPSPELGDPRPPRSRTRAAALSSKTPDQERPSNSFIRPQSTDLAIASARAATAPAVKAADEPSTPLASRKRRTSESKSVPTNKLRHPESLNAGERHRTPASHPPRGDIYEDITSPKPRATKRAKTYGSHSARQTLLTSHLCREDSVGSNTLAKVPASELKWLHDQETIHGRPPSKGPADSENNSLGRDAQFKKPLHSIEHQERQRLDTEDPIEDSEIESRSDSTTRRESSLRREMAERHRVLSQAQQKERMIDKSPKSRAWSTPIPKDMSPLDFMQVVLSRSSSANREQLTEDTRDSEEEVSASVGDTGSIQSQSEHESAEGSHDGNDILEVNRSDKAESERAEKERKAEEEREAHETARLEEENRERALQADQAQRKEEEIARQKEEEQARAAEEIKKQKDAEAAEKKRIEKEKKDKAAQERARKKALKEEQRVKNYNQDFAKVVQTPAKTEETLEDILAKITGSVKSMAEDMKKPLEARPVVEGGLKTARKTPSQPTNSGTRRASTVSSTKPHTRRKLSTTPVIPNAVHGEEHDVEESEQDDQEEAVLQNGPPGNSSTNIRRQRSVSFITDTEKPVMAAPVHTPLPTTPASILKKTSAQASSSGPSYQFTTSGGSTSRGAVSLSRTPSSEKSVQPKITTFTKGKARVVNPPSPKRDEAVVISDGEESSSSYFSSSSDDEAGPSSKHGTEPSSSGTNGRFNSTNVVENLPVNQILRSSSASKQETNPGTSEPSVTQEPTGKESRSKSRSPTRSPARYMSRTPSADSESDSESENDAEGKEARTEVASEETESTDSSSEDEEGEDSSSEDDEDEEEEEEQEAEEGQETTLPSSPPVLGKNDLAHGDERLMQDLDALLQSDARDTSSQPQSSLLPAMPTPSSPQASSPAKALAKRKSDFNTFKSLSDFKNTAVLGRGLRDGLAAAPPPAVAEMWASSQNRRVPAPSDDDEASSSEEGSSDDSSSSDDDDDDDDDEDSNPIPPSQRAGADVPKKQAGGNKFKGLFKRASVLSNVFSFSSSSQPAST